MANSNLLKEAIADAKAVRETAIANAKIALEEAFTPRLQSILSQKLQQEIEGEDEEDSVEEGTYNADGEEEITAEGEEVNEEYDKDDAPDAGASDIGDGDNKQPADDANSSSDVAQGNPDTDVETSEVGSEDENSEKAAEISEGEESEEEDSVEEGYMEDSHEEEDSVDEELDLESIIKELEAELSEEEEADHQEELDAEEKEEVEDIADDAIDSHEEEKHGEEEVEEEMYSEEEESEEDDLDEEIDLEEILREMGYGSDEVSEEEESEEEKEEVEENNELEEVKAELNEAISTIKELKSTINEVNLLNAKLLYTNKLFRAYELNNDQKHKVVETLDRTKNVREVKLVFSTLAESFKIGGTSKKQKSAKINESFASKPVASTAPKKEVIAESTNTMADRFKKLANII